MIPLTKWHAVEAALVPIGLALSWIATHLFGGWSPPVTQLFALSLIDFGTGWGASVIEAQTNSGPGLSSKRATRGVAKKVGIFVLIAAAHQVDRTLGQAHVLRDGVAYWFIAIELLSITENAGRMGLPVPPILVNVIAVLKAKGGDTPPTTPQKEGAA